MYSQAESQKIVDSYFAQLKQTKIIKIRDLFSGPEQTGETLNLVMKTTSQIRNNISLLSDLEKENARKYLQDKIKEIDSNILSRLSTISTKEEIPSFVYFVLGSILAYFFIDALKVPFLTLLLVSFGLISCLMVSLFLNSKNRYLYDYLLKLLSR